MRRDGQPGDGTKTFESLKADIQARYAGLSRQLQAIARFVLDHPTNVALETTATLARRLDVQPSALVRFAQALGYEGFSALQQVLRGHLVLRFGTMRDRLATLGTLRADARRGAASIAHDVIADMQAALERLRATVDPERLERASRLLARAAHVYVLGQGKSYPVAFYLHFALVRLDRPCTLLSGTGGIIAHQASLIRRTDALLAVSFRPYTQQVIDLARSRQQAGVPVIALTDGSLSPLWPTASVAFEVVEHGSPVYQSMIAPLCLAQILALHLGYRLMERGGTEAPPARRASRGRARPR